MQFSSRALESFIIYLVWAMALHFSLVFPWLLNCASDRALVIMWYILILQALLKLLYFDNGQELCVVVNIQRRCRGGPCVGVAAGNLLEDVPERIDGGDGIIILDFLLHQY